MLYRLSDLDGGASIEPVEFKNFSDYGKREKDLENLIAASLLDTLFEEAPCMPIFQERQWQSEADLYALDVYGNLLIFELKRGVGGEEAVLQALRYAQDAGQWTYAKLEEKYQSYTGSDGKLIDAHREAFDLDETLDLGRINQKQLIYVIGSAADESLVRSIDYWRRQGVLINFMPYRLYDLGGETYFEFFTPDYDQHKNPADTKGVLFDTNRSYDENSIWYMMEKSVVAAFGDAQRFVEYLHPGDYVFFSHKWKGIVAAAQVKSGSIKRDGDDTKFREVEFLTPVPKRGEAFTAMPFNLVTEATGKNFFWARTIKVPYLNKEESKILLDELKGYLERGNS